MCVGFDWQAKSAGKTKISKFDILAARVDQQVLWF